jgi:hypothetical protein
MSGGGGSGGPGGGPPRDSGIDCARIRFDTFLSSVDPAAAADLKVDEELRIELRIAPRALLAVRQNDAVVGAVTRKVRELLRCIQQQVEFKATVKHISGGDIEVRVEAV